MYKHKLGDIKQGCWFYRSNDENGEIFVKGERKDGVIHCRHIPDLFFEDVTYSPDTPVWTRTCSVVAGCNCKGIFY